MPGVMARALLRASASSPEGLASKREPRPDGPSNRNPRHLQGAPAGRRPVPEGGKVGEIRDLILDKLRQPSAKACRPRHPRLVHRHRLSVRDKVVESWLILNRGDQTDRSQAGLLSQPRIPDRAAAHRLADQYGADRTDPRSAGRAWRRSRNAARGRTERRARQWRSWTARRLLYGKHGDLLHRRLWIGIRYDHGCSASDQGRTPSSNSRGWLPSATLGIPAPRDRLERRLWRAHRGATGRDGETEAGLAAGETVEALAYDTPIPGWRGAHINTLRLWTARALDPLQLDQFNSGDHIGALMDRVRAEIDLEGALSRRHLRRRPGTPAAARVFLRLRLPAGSRSAANAPPRRHPDAGRQGRHPAERHASGYRRRRADAYPRRPA